MEMENPPEESWHEIDPDDSFHVIYSRRRAKPIFVKNWHSVGMEYIEGEFDRESLITKGFKLDSRRKGYIAEFGGFLRLQTVSVEDFNEAPSVGMLFLEVFWNYKALAKWLNDIK